MFEKLSQTAEQLATRVSRRQFLGRFAAGALALATALGGLLALPAEARAGGNARCCYYRCGGRGGTRGHYVCHADGSACSSGFNSQFGACTLRSQSRVSNCNRCRSY